ncbi:MAG: family 20 glycosylhydrolase [Chitinophagales bacterium]|nr:family 20 glycosylhydrolase [Chitinophagales bacterium]
MKILLFILLGLPLTNYAQQGFNIIPQPVKIETKTGKFVLDDKAAVQYNPQQKELKTAVDFLNLQLKTVAGFVLPVNVNRPTIIQLSIEKLDAIGNEGYKIEVAAQKIAIKANSKAGIMYGIQTLLQTFPVQIANAKLEIPCMNITDYPRFKYRGMHLDVGRHFYPLSFIKKYIDFMASYKFNYFHWHLTEDQGWRIEIKKYPELTTKASYRNGTIVGGYPGTSNSNLRYGGFYTQDEVREIVAYAAQRNITVVPEIELPGHSSAAIAAYPWLSCFPDKPTAMPSNASAMSKLLQSQGEIKLVQETWGVFDDIFCAGKDSTFIFLQDVLDEVVQLFPSKYIHVGGDEAPKKHWEKCPRCQAKIKSEGLKDEHELQSYFIQRMEKYLNKKGRTLIGWDEILEGGLAPNAVVMSWRGEAGGIEAAKQNHEVIMTPGNPVYFDHYQGDPSTEPVGIGGFNTLKKVYDYEPIPKELNEQQAKYVLGAQANLWTEYVPTTQHAEYMVLPRMLALSEVVWSPKENKNWNSFNERLQPHFTAFEQKGWNYSKGNFKTAIKPESQNGQLFVSLSTEAYKGKVVYTTDNSTPTTQSKFYTEPIAINASTTLKAAVLVDGKIMSAIPAQQNFVMHKAIGKDVNYANPVSRYYMADGPNSLTDGVRGANAVTKYWHGFSAKDMIATIDLGETKNIQNITLGCLQNYGDWIFLPQSVKFETSNDGISFTEIKTIKNAIDLNERNVLFDFKATFATQPARFIRVTAKNNLCPPGHSGEGKPGWIFADEIVVE